MCTIWPASSRASPPDGHRMFAVHVQGTRLRARPHSPPVVKRIPDGFHQRHHSVSKRADEMPDEDSPTPLELIAGWPYYASKLYQERTARLICGERIELVMVNPSLLLRARRRAHGSRATCSPTSPATSRSCLRRASTSWMRATWRPSFRGHGQGRLCERYLLGGHT